jgi:hypothetical protein
MYIHVASDKINVQLAHLQLPFSSAPVAIPLKNMKIPSTAGWGERGTNTVPKNNIKFLVTSL